MAGGIGDDALRIRDIDGDVLNRVRNTHRPRMPEFKQGDRLDHGVLIVWREGDIIKGLQGREPKQIIKQLVTIMKQMFENPETVTPGMLAEAILLNTPRKPVDARVGCLRWGTTRTEKRYWLAILRKHSSWDDLPDAPQPQAKYQNSKTISSGLP